MTRHAARLAAGLAAVRERVERACADAGARPPEVTVIVVTKFFPASDVLLLHDLGVRHFGENRDQEAGQEVLEVRRARRGGRERLVLHFIGRLQTNKAGHVAAYADVVQSVDRPPARQRPGPRAHAADRRLDVLLQVDLDTLRRRGADAPGAAFDPRTPRLADAVAGRDLLRLRGVMAVAPLGPTPTPRSPACARSRTAYGSVTRGLTGSRRA